MHGPGPCLTFPVPPPHTGAVLATIRRTAQRMTDLPILRDLGFIVVAATAVAFLSARLKVPSIVAFMVAGLVLGPLTGLVVVSEGVDTIAEVGIALLLFLVGLELSFERIRDVGK